MQNRNRNGLIAALDVGTSKICCFIARVSGEAEPEIVGIGHQASRGLRSGVIIDMDDAEDSIRSAVNAAEKMAGEQIERVTVNLSGPGLNSRLLACEVSIAGHQIGEADLRRIHDPSTLLGAIPAEHELVHAIPVGYSIDNNRGVRDPRGMYGERLAVNVHLVSTAAGAARNLATCIARCHLDIEDRVVSSYASALSCLSEDEMQLGVTFLDMGGGTTSIAVFFDGELVFADSVPLGGVQVTNDIARGLTTPLANAERMKTLYGSAIASSSDEREFIKVPLIGEEGDMEPAEV